MSRSLGLREDQREGERLVMWLAQVFVGDLQALSRASGAPPGPLPHWNALARGSEPARDNPYPSTAMPGFYCGGSVSRIDSR